MYVDKLDGRIDNAMYDKMSAEWRKQQDRCLREIGQHKTAERSYMDEGVMLLTLAKDAQRLFEKRLAADKRRLLNFVLSNSLWSNGELKATFRQPFNLIAETTGNGPDDDGGGGPNLSPRSVWWARQDSNLQPDRYERSRPRPRPRSRSGSMRCAYRANLSRPFGVRSFAREILSASPGALGKRARLRRSLSLPLSRVPLLTGLL